MNKQKQTFFLNINFAQFNISDDILALSDVFKC